MVDVAALVRSGMQVAGCGRWSPGAGCGVTTGGHAHQHAVPLLFGWFRHYSRNSGTQLSRTRRV